MSNRDRRHHRLTALVAAGGLGGVLLAGSGCKTPRATGPAPSAQRYLEHVAEGRADAAYDLLDESYRKQCDRACFKRLAIAQRVDARRALEELKLGGARIDEIVELALPDGTSLRLSRAGASGNAGTPEAGFVLVRNPLDFYPQSTPEETVRSFVRAVQARRYEVLTRFVPRALATELGAEQLKARFEGEGKATLAGQIEALKRHWDEPFIIDDKSARLPVGEGHEVRLVMEEGRWRIVQLS